MRERWRKRWLADTAIALAALLVCITLANVWQVHATARAALGDAPFASQVLLTAAEGLDDYTIDAVFDPETRTLRCTQTITYQNRAGETLDAVYFHAYANAFKREETSPAALAEVYNATYGTDGFSPGWLQMEDLRVGGQAAAYAYQGEAESILRVATPALAPGGTVEIAMTYTVHIPVCAYRFGVSGGVFALGDVFPVAALYEKGGWRLDEYTGIGDPFYSACANYDVTLTLPEGWIAATSGVQSTVAAEAGLTRLHVQAPAARSFAMAISNAFVVQSETVGDTRISSYALTSAGGKRALETAAKSLRYFSERYGAYPYPTLNVVSSDMPFGGVEYPGLVLISRTLFGTFFPQELAVTVAHEVAHQWFYALVGSDQIRSPWLDEALATYAALRYLEQSEFPAYADHLLLNEVEASMRVTVPQGVTIQSPITDFASFYEYATIVYNRGCAMLWGIGEAIGPDTMDEALRIYTSRHAYGLATRADFEDALREATGSDWAGYLADYLDTHITP